MNPLEGITARSGVFHLHVHQCSRDEFEPDCKRTDSHHLHLTAVPNEGLDWQGARFMTLEDDGLPLPVQAELLMMDLGFEATWLWYLCPDSVSFTTTCFVGQFGREGTIKRVKDSGAHRFVRN